MPLSLFEYFAFCIITGLAKIFLNKLEKIAAREDPSFKT